jgi:hypothetical protein
MTARRVVYRVNSVMDGSRATNCPGDTSEICEVECDAITMDMGSARSIGVNDKCVPTASNSKAVDFTPVGRNLVRVHKLPRDEPVMEKYSVATKIRFSREAVDNARLGNMM